MREDLLDQIERITGDNRSLYEKYSTSDLKQIVADLLTVRVDTSNVNMTVMLAGIFVLLAIYLFK